MKQENNKGKKALAVVGAVVAAGLTSGIVNASPVQGSSVGITAADVVAMDGTAYSFDELYAMQQRADGMKQARDRRQGPQASRYGAPSQHSQPAAKYGSPHSQPYVIVTPDMALDTIQEGLKDFCAQLLDADPYTKGAVFTLDSDLTRELEMSESQLKELKAFIEEYYGVEVSHHRFRLKGQLNTLRLISEYIYKLKSVWDRPEIEPY